MIKLKITSNIITILFFKTFIQNTIIIQNYYLPLPYIYVI